MRDVRPYEVAFWSQCTLYLNEAISSSTLMVINRPVVGDPPPYHYEAFVRQNSGRLHVTKHRWCHWGMTRDGMSSSNSQDLWSNAKIPEHPCRCPTGTKHYNLLSPSGDEGGNLRYRLSVEYSKRLLVSIASTMGFAPGPSRLHGVTLGVPSSAALGKLVQASPVTKSVRFSPELDIVTSNDGEPNLLGPMERGEPVPGPQRIPDSVVPSNTDVKLAYPTASKERERIKRNELKAQGIDPKSLVVKREKYIEPHYDDCGDDLSSIASELKEHLVVDTIYDCT